jgi:hypothetical protein
MTLSQVRIAIVDDDDAVRAWRVPRRYSAEVAASARERSLAVLARTSPTASS